MKGVGNMRRILSFIFAILIVVFAVMPNVYAEAQKNYGNLDMSRWAVIVQAEEMDILVDKNTIDYKLNLKNNLLCNLWVCHFMNNKDEYELQNITFNYDEKTLSIDSLIKYNKEGVLQDSYTPSYQEFEKIVPESIGEIFYIALFPKEKLNDIRNYVTQNK